MVRSNSMHSLSCEIYDSSMDFFYAWDILPFAISRMFGHVAMIQYRLFDIFQLCPSLLNERFSSRDKYARYEKM